MTQKAQQAGGNQEKKPVYQRVLSRQSGNERENILPDNPSRESEKAFREHVRFSLGIADSHARL